MFDMENLFKALLSNLKCTSKTHNHILLLIVIFKANRHKVYFSYGDIFTVNFADVNY